MPNRADPRRNFVSSPLGERNAVQFTVKTDHTAGASSPLDVRYSFSRDDRDLPFPARGRNLPGFGISVLDQGHNFAAGLTQALVAARVQRAAHRRQRAAPREPAAERGHRPVRGARHHRARARAAPTSAIRRWCCRDSRRSATIRTCRSSASTRTIHISDSLTLDRGRHHFKLGGELRHYQSDGYNHLFARGQATFTGAFTGHSGRRSAARLSDDHAARRERQPPGAAHVVALNAVRAGRLAGGAALTLNAGVRYEYNTPPYDADDRMRIFDLATLQLRQVGRGRRLAIGAGRRPQQLRAARRR